jgi:hypothetical protein
MRIKYQYAVNTEVKEPVVLINVIESTKFAVVDVTTCQVPGKKNTIHKAQSVDTFYRALAV